jgi:protein arginine N-methyltransferase 5
MFSWFPIFFPLKTPMGIRKGDVISVHFWRKADKHKVGD